MSELLDRFNKPGQKKILSLDGGGIRGALTLGYLKKLEDILKAKFPDQPDFRLCDYFDLIGGTSTGSIIAASLAIGKTVDEITKLYMDLGGKIFGEKRNWWNPMETMKWLKANYSYKAMEDGLKFAYGDLTMGSKELKTGLCIVAKRADTNSIWPLINHPKGKFFDSDLGKNKDIPLWMAVRASSAAPTYFAPQMIEVMKDQQAAFIDGGLSMANNPSLTLLMIATLKGFPFRWEMAEDKLLFVSVGTGYSVFKKYAKEIDDSTMLSWAANIPDMLMQDASWQNRLMMQWLSNSPTADYMDMEIEKMDDDYLAGKPIISYLRYNFRITENDLNELGFTRIFTAADVKSITDMSNSANRQLLYQIGWKASYAIKPEHFEKF
ncbi:patatin [Ginsengibacter hankyongi]|uniref:Patatin n=1 Tax=Ginsengibacter hankyongi TaxID=2607284 RepID=A0A5J5IJN8_9BACT|nr:patatin-like phospholipase family protein [Ginsengibacter hankyongi]KAA9041259.1 patatin [Ginsengibacter hankyongi]